MTTDKIFSASKLILFFCSMDDTLILDTKPIKPNDVYNGSVLLYNGHRFGIRITEKLRLIITYVDDENCPATLIGQRTAITALNDICKSCLNDVDKFGASNVLLLSLMLNAATRR